MSTPIGKISFFTTVRLAALLVMLLPGLYTAAQPFSPTVYSGWAGGTTGPFASIPAAAGLTFSQITRGAGVGSVSATDGINADGWADAASGAAALTANNYFQLTVTANAGVAFTVSSINLGYRRSGTGPTNFQMYYSVNGGPFATFGTTYTTTTANTANTFHSASFTPGTPIAVPAGENIVIRITSWSASSAGGTLRILNNTAINGTVVPGTNSLATSGVTGTPFCVSSSGGAPTNVSYTATGAFSGSNVFTAELSDAAGSFATPVAIGTFPGNALTGTINATVPPGTVPGTGYRIRVVSNLPAVTGTDNGSDLIVIPGVSFTSTVTPISCNGMNDGAISTTVTEGVSPYNYLWSNGNTTTAISALTPGTYSLTITASNGCVAYGLPVTLTDPAVIATAPVITPAGCNGTSDGAAALNVSGGTSPYTYAWSNSATTSAISGVTAGTYSVTITDDHGCTQTASVTITEPAVLAASATTTDAGCNGASDGAATLTVSGGTSPYTYAWSNSATTQNLSNIPAGSYSVTITDDNGCTQTASVTITEPVVLAASATTTDAGCNGASDGSATLTVSGGTSPYTYAWSNSATTQNISNIPAGSYSVTITDDNGCTQTASVTITEPVVLAASATTTDAGCNGASDGSATLTVTGGTSPYTYAWSNSATTQNLSNIPAGSYSVTITDDNGCTQTASVTITEPVVLAASATTTDAGCNGASDGSATLTVSGGTAPYTYAWSNSATTQNLSNIPAGTYSVTITDDNGCTQTTSVTVSEPAVLAATPVTTSPGCNGASDGSIMLNMSGGTAPYTYAWSNSATTQNLSNITAGTYSVTITDDNGCTQTASVTLSQPAVLTNTYTATDVLCNGGTNGSVSLAVNGGTSPYTYAWSNGGNTQVISNLVNGTYSVTITDANGCTSTTTVTLTAPPAITGTIISTNATCGSCPDGSADLSVNGGVGPYAYLWSNGATTEDISAVVPGTYTVTVTDSNGCTMTQTVVINFSTGIAAAETTYSIGLYPNPSDGNFTIALPVGSEPQSIVFAVYDLSGKLVYTTSLTGELVSVRIPVENGIYVYALRDAEKQLQTGKLIIAH